LAVSKILSSAPVGTGTNFAGAKITCDITNAGSSAVTIKSVAVLNASGNTTNDFSNCPASLASERNCSLGDNDVEPGLCVCRVRVEGSGIKVRGIAVYCPGGSDVPIASPME
jgi:hypothetical protein